MATRLSSRMLQKCSQNTLCRPITSSLRPRASSPLLKLSSPARYASYYPHLEPKQKKGVKIGHIFSALALLGIGATAFGLYDFYQSFTAFPSPIRNHLRTALRAINDGAFPRADASFSAAYDLALDMAKKGELGNQQDALMKTTGVAIRWGGMWEEAGELGRATEVYSKAFAELTWLLDSNKATKKVVMRAVAIAMKLGDLAILMEAETKDLNALATAEKMYTFCVQEMMRLKMTPAQLEKVREEMENGPKPKVEGGEKDELETDLPSWAGDVQLTAGMERLGELYAKLGNVELATPLLQQTIALLLPPPPKDGSEHIRPPIPTRCHAATLMNNLSSVLVSAASPTAKDIEGAVRWSGQALTVAGRAKKDAEAARKGKVVPLAEREEAECDLVAVVGAYNLGKLSELSSDKVAAKAWFEQSLVQSRRIGREGTEAIEALRRL